VASSWLEVGSPVDWHDFEAASATGKEIVERIAGDRSLLRQLTFTAHERPGDVAAGLWAEDGGELELFADDSRKIFLYLHVGLGEHHDQAAELAVSYVAKVLTGAYRHVWYSAGDGVAYVTDEQPPGLYSVRAGLIHSLSWDAHSTALVLREARVEAPAGGGLREGQYIALRNQADIAGIL
jgi:hypothetical protein